MRLILIAVISFFNIGNVLAQSSIELPLQNGSIHSFTTGDAIYLNACGNDPEEYEIIARIDASSEFAFRDPSFDITWQSKMDKMIQRLKIEAAQLGANGIVIEGTTNQTRQNMRAEENGTSISESHFKTGTATAIFVNTF